jgi:nucleotide-binding universal stress UspA family protein
MTQPQGAPQRRVVVGVDGSDPSKAALAWAMRQAELTHAVVDAVMAWEFPNIYGLASLGDVDFQSIAEQIVADTVTEMSSFPGQTVIRPHVVIANAIQALLDASAGAKLLGSVSQHCLQHATCPVVVVRGAQHPSAP